MTNTGLDYWLDKEIVVIKPLSNQEVMVVTAHPDDVESECAGSLALAKDNGSRIRVLIATSGKNKKVRVAEALNAASIIGIDEVQVLDFPDGTLENTLEVKEQIVYYLRLWKPAVVLTYDPDYSLPLYVSHPDHRAIGRATLDSVFPLARTKDSFPEQGLPPHKVKSVWLFGSANATKYVDITTSFDRKVAARLEHKSQVRNPNVIKHNWQQMNSSTGKRANLAFAEAFTLIHVD